MSAATGIVQNWTADGRREGSEAHRTGNCHIDTDGGEDGDVAIDDVPIDAVDGDVAIDNVALDAVKDIGNMIRILQEVHIGEGVRAANKRQPRANVRTDVMRC